jgi:DNA repair ATPase RecN
MNIDMPSIMNYVSIINIFIIPTVMFSLKYFIVDITKKQIDEFKTEINKDLDKIDVAYSKGYVRMEAKLQAIDEKIDKYISENQRLIMDIKIKLNEIEMQNSKINFLDRDVQDNKKNIEKMSEETDKRIHDVGQRLNSRIDDFIGRNRSQ